MPSPKLNVIARLEFKLANYDITDLHVNHYVTRTSSINIHSQYLTMLHFIMKRSISTKHTGRKRLPKKTKLFSQLGL